MRFHSGRGYHTTSFPKHGFNNMGQIPEGLTGKTEATREWENEGGSVKSEPAPPLPDGITPVTVIQYRVGPYTYSRLDDALAEHKRQFEKE